MKPSSTLIALTLVAPTAGCDALFSETAAPAIAGDWSISYQNDLEVRIAIAGAVYTEMLGPQGGIVEITHDGQPFQFDLDCAKAEVICPSEAWTGEVSIESRSEKFPHQFHLLLPGQECNGATVAADSAMCGDATDNPDCEDVCMGEVVMSQVERLGVIDEAGESFEVLLGAGVATNGINCAMLGLSITRADLVTSGAPMEEDWTVDEFSNGEVVVGYAGGCAWVADPNDDGTLEAVALGASIELTTHYTGARL